MSGTLVWLGTEGVPDAVTIAAERQDWEAVSVSPADGAAAVTRHRPTVVASASPIPEPVGAAAPDAVLAYVPATTDPDAVSEAVAAGANVVLPQDSAGWGPTTFTERVADAEVPGPPELATTPTSDGGSHSPREFAAGEPPEPTASTDGEPLSDPHPEQGILTVDSDGKVSYVGARAAELLSMEATDLLGERLTDTLPWTNIERLDAASMELSPGDEGVSVATRLMPENRWLELTAHPTASGATVSIRALDADERRKIVLDGLHGVTRRLFGATSKTGVAEIACDASRDVLGLEAVVVRLREDGELRPVAQSEAVEELMPERPTYEDDEGMAGTAFEDGQPRIRTDDEEGRFGAMRSCMYLPLGSHGVLSIASVTADAFDDEDVQLANLLATTVTAALDRAEREQQLRRREAVLESVRGMVFVLDGDRNLDYVSDSLAERLGAPRAELLGQHVVEFVDITEYYRAESLFEALETADEGVSVPMRVKPVDGEPFHAAVELSKLAGTDDVVVGVVEDRSALVETQDDLEQERERLWTLFENLPDPVVETEHVDGRPVIRTVNDAFSDVFGHNREDVLDKPLDDVLVPPADERTVGPEAESINRRVEKGEVTGEKVRRETVDGSRSFLFRGIPYTQNGDTRAFAIYTDVTDIERQEHHAKVLDRLLRHNLRNELGVVIGYAENIVMDASDPDMRTQAQLVVEAARELVELSDTAKRIRRIIETPDANRHVVRAETLFADAAATAGDQFPSLTVETETSHPELSVWADEHLEVALEELLDNAAQHGGDRVTLRADPVPAVPEKWVDIRVTDDGAGIPEAERAAVTGHRSITQLDHGSGLGLWLVRWAVESVGGDLAFECEDGGTVVRLRLRRAK